MIRSTAVNFTGRVATRVENIFHQMKIAQRQAQPICHMLDNMRKSAGELVRPVRVGLKKTGNAVSKLPKKGSYWLRLMYNPGLRLVHPAPRPSEDFECSR